MERNVCFLIDDDDEDAEIFGYALEETGLGYSLKTASSRKDAIEYLSDGGFVPDYIFMDLVMPGMSAQECLTTLHGIPTISDVPIVVSSSSHYLAMDEGMLKQYATHFFVKPVKIEQLTEILVKILKRERVGFVLE